MIYDKYESEFNTNTELMYRKIRLFYYIGRCYISQDKLERGLEFLQQSLDLTKEHRPHDLQLLVACLYNKSWNQLISGQLHDALITINEAVSILDENKEQFPSIRSHQQRIIECQSSPQTRSRHNLLKL